MCARCWNTVGANWPPVWGMTRLRTKTVVPGNCTSPVGEDTGTGRPILGLVAKWNMEPPPAAVVLALLNPLGFNAGDVAARHGSYPEGVASRSPGSRSAPRVTRGRPN